MANTIIKQTSKANDFQDETSKYSKLLTAVKERISPRFFVLVLMYIAIICLQASKAFSINVRAIFAVAEIGLSLYISYSIGYLGMVLCISGNSMAAVSLFMTSRHVASVLEQDTTQLSVELTKITESTVGLFVVLSATRVALITACIIIAYASAMGKKNIRRLEFLANIDGVTGAFNHRYFQTKLIEEIARANDANITLAMIMIDLDNFKMYNDKYGHQAGDVLLYKTSQIFMKETRDQDTVCRYGGDEFAILLPDTNLESTSVVIELIRKSFDKMTNLEEFCASSDKVTLSIGYSLYPDLAKNKDDLIFQSDSALYQAKRLGRNNSQLYKAFFEEFREQCHNKTGIF